MSKEEKTKTMLHSHNYDSTLLERLLFRAAKKWVAGYSIDEAINAAKDANRRGMSAILNFLGEDVIENSQIEATIKEYLLLINILSAQGIKGCISVKPTQLGLAVDYYTCLENFGILAKKANDLRQFIWIDMESARFTEDTITIYLEILKNYPTTGIAIQAYLRRSGADILHIMEHKGIVRLVKGAYHEPEENAFVTREEIDSNYIHLLRMLAESNDEHDNRGKINNPNFFAVATHDEKLVREALDIKAKKKCEFQMLMGIRDELKLQLVSMGMPVSEYIPYGNQWLPYSVRRIRERKRNLLLLARSLVQS